MCCIWPSAPRVVLVYLMSLWRVTTTTENYIRVFISPIGVCTRGIRSIVTMVNMWARMISTRATVVMAAATTKVMAANSR